MDKKKIIGIALCSKISWNLLFDDDSSSEDETPKTNPKTLLYYENTICKFDNQQFKAHFRMTPSTLEVLYQNILAIETKYVDVVRGHSRISLEKQLLMTLWYVANTECFRSVSDRFGVSISGCWTSILDICDKIIKVNFEQKIIVWPSEERAVQIAAYFENKTKFPGIIGCINGSHIPIPAPKEYPNSYVNRKKFHSILLQSVCDEKLQFTDCYTGEAGSIHDSCLFRRSNLFKKISNGTIIIPAHQDMLGDLGYGIKTYLLTPFKDTGNITRQQLNYNMSHSTARVTIERAFGLLKGRFRRLTGLNTRRPDFIVLIIMTGCILHNLCLQNGDSIPDDTNIILNDGSTDSAVTSNDSIAIEKRNRILRIFNN